MPNKLTGYRISSDTKERISEFALEYGNGMSNRFIDAMFQFADTGEPVINNIRIRDCMEDIMNGKWLSGKLTGKLLSADRVIYQNFTDWLNDEDEGLGGVILENLCSYDTVKQFLNANPQWIPKLQENFLEAENGHPLKAGTVTRYLTEWYSEKEQSGESSRALAAVIHKNRAARLRRERGEDD